MKLNIKENARIDTLNAEFVEIAYLNEHNVDEVKKIYFSDKIPMVYIVNSSDDAMRILPEDFKVFSNIERATCNIAYTTRRKTIQYSKTSSVEVERNFVSRLFILLDDHVYYLVADYLASKLLKYEKEKETVL